MKKQLEFETFMAERAFRFINVPTERIDQEIRDGLESALALLGFEWVVLAERVLDADGFRPVQTVCRNASLSDRQITAWVLSPRHIAAMTRGNRAIATHVPTNVFKVMTTTETTASDPERQWIIGLPFGDGDDMTGFLAFGAVHTAVSDNMEGDGRLKRIGQLFESALVRRTTALQFDELFRFERLLSEISSTFSGVPAEAVDRTVEYGLARISAFLGADYCNLVPFTSNLDHSRDVVHSWVREGAPPLPNFEARLSDLFPWFADKFRRGEVVYFSSPDDLPAAAAADRNEFKRMGTKSHVSVPIAVDRIIIAVLSIGTIRRHRSWPEELVQRLRLIGEIFANAIVRKEKQLEIQQAFSQIEQLNTQLSAECTYLRQEIELSSDYHNMIGQSDALKQVIDQIGRIATTDVIVLINGETGTGKELVARAIHAAGKRKDRPMVKVNCAALPDNLIESELFGHEKGAFTSAQNRQIGRFELAHGSSLFLDEIGEMPMASQAKLLRVLQEGEFERLGSSKTIRVDVRIIAATNRDLEKEVRKGRFRQDLWYRLNVFPIDVPPLRQRPEDIPLLVNWFILKAGKKLGKTIERVPTKTMRALQQYDWPGNVRELENVIERAVINSPHTSLVLLDQLDRPGGAPEIMAERLTLEEMMRAYIVQTLEETNGRVEGPQGAALILGLHPSTLRSRMRKMGIKVGAFVE